MREVFKDYITDITANLEKHGLHSLRAGEDSQGRWSSEKARNGYIKDRVSTRLSVSKMLRQTQDRLEQIL